MLKGNGNASSVSQKQLTDNKDANIATSSSVPARPRSKKQNGSTSSSGGVAQTSAIGSPSVDPRSNNPSARDHNHRSGPVSHSQNGNEHPQQQRSSLRHRSGGNYSRGDGPYQHNYGVRRDQERGNQELSGHRNFNNNRDSHMPQQRAAISRYGRPSAPPPIPPASAYIGPASVRPFGGPVVYPGKADYVNCQNLSSERFALMFFIFFRGSSVLCPHSTHGFTECSLLSAHTASYGLFATS